MHLLDEINLLALELREKIGDNLRMNVKDQMQADAIVEFSLCFDLSLTSTLEDRIVNLEKLHSIYYTDHEHEVDDPTITFTDNWTVKMKYPAKLQCKIDDLTK